MLVLSYWLYRITQKFTERHKIFNFFCVSVFFCFLPCLICYLFTYVAQLVPWSNRRGSFPSALGHPAAIWCSGLAFCQKCEPELHDHCPVWLWKLCWAKFRWSRLRSWWVPCHYLLSYFEWFSNIKIEGKYFSKTILIRENKVVKTSNLNCLLSCSKNV